MQTKFTKTILFSLLIVAAGLSFTGATKKYKYHNMKLPQVSIVAPGELFSTYQFTEEENRLVRAAVKGDESLFLEIEKCHMEEYWPEPLKDFNWRIAHGDVIKKFVAYKLCALEGDRCLLVIPLVKNKKVKEVEFTRDIYIVIRTTAIK